MRKSSLIFQVVFGIYPPALQVTGRKMQQVILDSDSESDTCEEVGDRTNISNETQEYFEASIKCEKIVISSDSEDDIHIHVIPTFQIPKFQKVQTAQNLYRTGEEVNLEGIITDLFENDPWTKCCLCNTTIKHKNFEKHYQKVHRDEMKQKCKEALQDLIYLRQSF